MAIKVLLDEYIIAEGIPQKTAVRQALESRLKKITKSNGYWNDITVYDYEKRSYDDEDTQYPYIRIVNTGLSLKSFAGESIQMENSLLISCVVYVDSEVDDYEIKLEELEEDVLRCLLPDKIGMKPGAFNTLNIEISDIQYYPREDGSNEASLDLTITFNTSIKTRKEP